jgi:hypothetical protein
VTVKTIRIVTINLLVFGAILMVVEVALQGVAVIWPSYDVLFLKPDRVLGWKMVPNFHWQWTGHHWYASDFSVAVAANSDGFRDVDRETGKPDDVKRVALLGDSFIEAVQVPFKDTAGQHLERLLNSPSHRSASRWEVLNFGVSNYGVGQYMLAWDEYASKYGADYVAVFVAKLHMKRAVTKYESGAFREGNSSLWVRPTFRIDDGRLLAEPARDFDRFVDAQDALIQTEFDGQRSRRKKSQLLTLYFARQLKNDVSNLIRTRDTHPKAANAASVSQPAEDAEAVGVGLQIIRALGKKVSDKGAKLIVLDVSRYLGDDDALSAELEKLCGENDYGYVPVDKELLNANLRGISTRWPHDGHLNDAGNEILAKAMLSWFDRHPEPSQSVR